MLSMLEFLLKTRIKYVAFSIFLLFFVILFLSMFDNRVEEEQLGFIQYKKNLLEKEVERLKASKQQTKGGDPSVPAAPADFRVQFISGKELAEEVDNEKKSFQVHKVKIMNLEKSKVVIDCEDAFSNFGRAIPPGGSFEFRVTDLFAKRHYWCTAKYGVSQYLFRAYGEGAPRDNNVVSLHKEGAFINGKLMNIEDEPMQKTKVSARSLGGRVPYQDGIDHPHETFPHPGPGHPEEESMGVLADGGDSGGRGGHHDPVPNDST